MASFGKHHGKLFSQGGNYARYRPTYPPTLFSALWKFMGREEKKGGGVAVDVGCGTGQVAVELAPHFREVVGVDPSEAQLEKAEARQNVRYVAGSVEALPVDDASVDLVTIAQAADVWQECSRVLRPGGTIAVCGYSLASLPDHPTATATLKDYHERVLGPYWEKNRQLVDNGYAHLEMPYGERETVHLAMEKRMPFSAFMGYLGTQSALKTLREKVPERQIDALEEVRTRLQDATGFGEEDKELLVRWPLFLYMAKKPAA